MNIDYLSIENYFRSNGVQGGPLYADLRQAGLSDLFVKPFLDCFCITKNYQDLIKIFNNKINDRLIQEVLKKEYPNYLVSLVHGDLEFFYDSARITDQKLFQGDIKTLNTATQYVLKSHLEELKQMSTMQVSR
ncbi:MAG TPA: hypothetical protein DHU33_03175 [Firmicutes bacterium]|nr:hypothetical protein [Bacillota bacterium]